MPIEIVWEEQCVLATYRGEVSHEGIVDSYRRIEGDRRFDELRCSIIDLRELSPAVPDAHLLEEIAAENWAASASNRRLTTAVVARNSAIIDAVQRYQTFMPEPRHIPDVLVCASVDEARQALGLSP
jgi:hypothetical protein